MTELADLDERFARLEAALAETAKALDSADAAARGRPDQSDAERDLEAELAAARARIEALEQDARVREATQGEAVVASEAGDAGSGASDASGRVAELEAKVASLRAARAEDLSEMKALLAELEPLVEGVNA